MTPLTIPKKSLPKDDLVIIARKDYEKFLEIVKWKQTLDEDLEESLGQAKRGELIGPFISGKALVDALRK